MKKTRDEKPYSTSIMLTSTIRDDFKTFASYKKIQMGELADIAIVDFMNRYYESSKAEIKAIPLTKIKITKIEETRNEMRERKKNEDKDIRDLILGDDYVSTP